MTSICPAWSTAPSFAAPTPMHGSFASIHPRQRRSGAFSRSFSPGMSPDSLFNCAGNPPSPILIKDERILTDQPLYVGDRIAAVAALTPEACREALDKLVVEIEPLPAVFEIEDALRKEAPLLHPEISQTNIFKKMEARKGEVEKGFAESEHIFEGEYRTPDVQHVAMEPVSCICHYAR